MSLGDRGAATKSFLYHPEQSFVNTDLMRPRLISYQPREIAQHSLTHSKSLATQVHIQGYLLQQGKGRALSF